MINLLDITEWKDLMFKAGLQQYEGNGSSYGWNRAYRSVFGTVAFLHCDKWVL